MRKIVVLSMISLDGVMQAPGSPEEDQSNGFGYGGWVAPFDDDISGEVMQKLMQPSDLLLGRKTFEIWENYWPAHSSMWPGINEATKYVCATTRNQSEWNNSVFLNDISDIQELKNTDGADIQVWGSSELIQSLLKFDLVDELWLMIHPLTLGKGKKLFQDGTIAASFTLATHVVTNKGVIIGHYKRAGAVETGAIDA
jgi:dihydrofolate reductase